jgi:arabinogalactan endo-1,4-beta-galactosidase
MESMVFEMEFEIDPAEEQETVPRDLRERRGTTCNRGALMTILPLAAFMMAALLRVLNVRELSCHRFGMCAANANESQHANDQTQSTTRGRKLVQIHVGFDGSEALGAKRSNVPFKDVDGTPKDPLQIFKDHGYTYSRLRVMVGPSGSYGLFQDVEYVKEMAREIVLKNSMKLLLDFHYSHWWADPENQWIPLDWRNDDDNDTGSTRNQSKNSNSNVTLDVLKEHVYNHTRAVMEELIAQGTTPDAVQIGNEVNAGMLWEEGKIVNGNMHNFVQITNTAIRAMKDSFKKVDVDTDFPQIVMHLAAGGWTEFTQHWFTNFTKAGGVFDVIGLSYYPFWHGSLQDLSDNMKNIKAVFPDKSVWVVECAYYWTETSHDFVNLPFDQTEDGQFDYLKALLGVLKNYGHDTAVFYWGSHWTQPNLWINSDETWEETENRSLFDSNAQALKGIDALIG